MATHRFKMIAAAVTVCCTLVSGCPKRGMSAPEQVPAGQQAPSAQPPEEAPPDRMEPAAPAESSPWVGVGKPSATEAPSLRSIMVDTIGPADRSLRDAAARGDTTQVVLSAGAIADAAQGLRDAAGAPEATADRDKFIGYSDDLALAASTVATASRTGDPSALDPALRELGLACAACHQDFRPRPSD